MTGLISAFRGKSKTPSSASIAGSGSVLEMARIDIILMINQVTKLERIMPPIFTSILIGILVFDIKFDFITVPSIRP